MKSPRQVFEQEISRNQTDMTWRPYGIETPEAEFRFHLTRRWRFDYAWPDRKIAVEIDGGIWSRGRHTRGFGYLGDMEKQNHAGLSGWRIFKFTPQQLKKGEAQEFMKQVLS